MDFMQILTAVLAIFILFFIIIQIRSRIPRIIAFFTPGRRAMLFQDDPHPPINVINLEMIRSTREKLQSLGFSELGIMLEKAPLWAKPSQELVMVSSQDKIIASLGLNGLKASYFLYTPFEGGQVVITAHNCFRNFYKSDFMTTEIKSGDLDEMLESHRKDVAGMIEKGQTPFRDYTRETVIEATRQYYRASYPKSQLRVAGVTNTLIFVISVLIFVMLVRSLFT